MCGIAGIVHGDPGQPGDRQRIQAMADALVHRGPDGDGFRVGEGYALGHRRLAIVDIAQGQQPMSDAEQKVWVTFNGEIYNHDELRQELQAQGYRFRTRCDTEVILHGYRAWGDRLPERLFGMFAFGIWDEHQRRLMLARDRVGKKPLYFTRNDVGELLFASEIKALLADPKQPRRLDRSAIAPYLCLGYVSGGTIYQGIEQLAPGSAMTWQAGKSRSWRYWSLQPAPRQGGDLATEQERCLELMDLAVRQRLMGEVPLGAFLSGGVDSQGVLDSMARSSDGSVLACTVGFDDPKTDERPAAREAALASGAELHQEVVGIDDMLDLTWFADTFDEPFADSSAIPTYHVSRMARRHVTVALSGDGGDECFAGYRRYKFDAAENLWRRRLPRWLWGAMGALYPKADFLPRPLRAKRTLQNLGLAADDAYARSVSRALPEEVLALLRPEFRVDDPLQAVRRAYAEQDGPPVYRCIAADFATWLPADILTKVDRASMAVSLEVRAPLLDHRLIEFAMTLPVRWQFLNGEGKGFFRDALRGRLGRRVDRPKQGFHVPMRDWMRGKLGDALQQSLTGDRLATLLDVERATQLLTQHRGGMRDHSQLLWAMLVLDRFLDRWGAQP